MKNSFDVVVIGAGHAGCEAALANARMGLNTLMLTLSLDSIAFLACNPSIGGTAKGHLVREIDALGGEMGVNADKTLLQIKMLNTAKGAAVQSLRAQADKNKYHTEMKKTLEKQKNLTICQGEVSEILSDGEKIIGVKTAEGITYDTKAVVVATGVYLSSDIIRGKYRKNSGPNGFAPANLLTESLINLGFEIRRFKTGTPARIDKTSIDFDKFEIEYGDKSVYPFSFITDKLYFEEQPCYLGYTNQKTHEIIRNNISLAPMYSGDIKGIGPRYCPSIEDKVVRFSEKERHQIFIEPEGADTNEMYIQGVSTSFPIEIQELLYHSISGLENAKIMRYAYAIEYDCINSLDLLPTLGFKKLKGIYMAGQINGSSGYEEAGAQGLIAGINAGLYVQNKKPFILNRDEAYIGVLIDDLVTKGTNEPYRMMTSRAEYRLTLRQDNADLRLTEKGRAIGLVDNLRYEKFKNKIKDMEEIRKLLEEKHKVSHLKNFFEIESTTAGSLSFKELLLRNIATITEFGCVNEKFNLFDKQTLEAVQIELRYSGYLQKQEQQILKAKKMEEFSLPEDFDYSKLKGLRIEAQQKLNKIKPLSIGQASRISGVSPADIAVLLTQISMKKL